MSADGGDITVGAEGEGRSFSAGRVEEPRRDPRDAFSQRTIPRLWVRYKGCGGRGGDSPFLRGDIIE